MQNGLTCIGAISDEELAAEIRTLRIDDWEETVTFFFRYMAYMGGADPGLSPEVFYPLGKLPQGGGLDHPVPPPIVNAHMGRMFVVGDSVLWC